MAEWSNAAVLKTAEPETVPGFESLSFRHLFYPHNFISYSIDSICTFDAYVLDMFLGFSLFPE